MTLNPSHRSAAFQRAKTADRARAARRAIKGAGDTDELLPNEFATRNEAQVAAALEQLKIEYIEQSRAFQLVEKAEGWQLVSDPAYAPWVRQLFPAAKPARLTPPALETLAIIAYRQPITRADVEAVRGVAVDGVLQSLMERGLVKIAGAPRFRAGRCSTKRRNSSSNISACAIWTNCRMPRNCARRYLPVAPRHLAGTGEPKQKSASDDPSGSDPESATPAQPLRRRIDLAAHFEDFAQDRRLISRITRFYLI